jgi:type IV secretory pathway VirB9-like protein
MRLYLTLLIALTTSTVPAQPRPTTIPATLPAATRIALEPTAPLATPPSIAIPPPRFDKPLVIDYSPDEIPIIRTHIRYSTVIVLPASERIIETVCGDKDWWQIDPVENILYVKPTKASISTNLTVLGKSGTLYVFALEEITESHNLQPQVKVTVRWPESIRIENATHGPKYVTKAELDSVVQDYQQQLQTATQNVRTAQTAAKTYVQDEVTKMRTQYPAELQFDYDIALDSKPFYVRAMYSDKKFTYLKLDAPEAPAVYEIKDGKPNLVNFDYVNGIFIIRKVIDQGYLAIGKAKLHFTKKNH